MPQVPSFDPTPEMVENNEMLASALQASPGILHERFQQYGDVRSLASERRPLFVPYSHSSFLPLLSFSFLKLGVLGWCNDFKELVDAIKDAGVGGTLFVATRDQGLETCRQVLSMELDIKKGMVLLYLSTQVSRLRRFLDGEAEPGQHADSGVSFSS